MNNQEEFNALRERMCQGAHFDQILRDGHRYIYPHRNAGIIGKAKNRWDTALDANNVLAILDTRFWHGMIFTVNGAYYRDSDEKERVFYFNYDDITDLDIGQDGKSLSMVFSNGESRINKNWWFYNMHALRDALRFLHNFAVTEVEMIDPRRTGWLNRPWMSQKERDECNVIIQSAVLSGNSDGMIEQLAEVFGVSEDSPGVRALKNNLNAAIQGRGSISDALVGWAPQGQQLINLGVKTGVIEAMGWMAASHFLKQST